MLTGHIRNYTGLVPHPVRFGLRRLLYMGNAFECELCGHQIRKLLNHGGGPDVLERRKVVGGMRREQDRCPLCHACDRTRMMMLFLRRQAGVEREALRVLHVAPEYGLYLWLRRLPNITYVASDIDRRRYRHIKNIQSADLTDMPFEEEQFDLIICSHVLEHIPDDMKAMREIRRILKTDGCALLLTPFATDQFGTDEDPTIGSAIELERRFGQWDHVRLYDREDFFSRLQRVGFQTRTYSPFEEDTDEASRLRLNPLEVLPIGSKGSAH